VLARKAGEVEALVQPTGEQHDAVEPANGRERGVRRGGLRVVEPLHATNGAQRLDAMWWMVKRREAGLHVGRSGQAALQHQRGSSQRIGEVVGQGACHARDGSDDAARPDEGAIVDAVVGVGGGERVGPPAAQVRITVSRRRSR
jgi:hypothetical protein